MSVCIMTYWEDISQLKKISGTISFYSYRVDDSRVLKILKNIYHYSSIIKGEKIINIYQAPTRIALNEWLGKNKINIFLNHGWGTKKSPGNEEIKIKKILNEYRLLRKYTDYIICYNDFDATYYLRHSLLDDLPYPKFIALGHPRNDFLVSNRTNHNLIEKIKNDLKIEAGTKTILYAPTHRRLTWKESEEDREFLNNIFNELKEMDKAMRDKNIKIIFRPSYLVRNLKLGFKNIINGSVNVFPDPRLLMLASDILVTDYSSIYVDYLLLGKPIVYYQPDIERYMEARGLVVDPLNSIQMPGPKVTKLKDILEISEEDFAKFDLERAKKFFHKYCDDKATERLFQFILKLVSGQEIK